MMSIEKYTQKDGQTGWLAHISQKKRNRKSCALLLNKGINTVLALIVINAVSDVVDRCIVCLQQRALSDLYFTVGPFLLADMASPGESLAGQVIKDQVVPLNPLVGIQLIEGFKTASPVVAMMGFH